MFSTNSLWQSDTSGNQLVYNDTSEIKERLENLFTSLFKDISTDSNTPQGQIISFLSQLGEQVQADIQTAINAVFNGGSGDYLDAWAWNNFRATRRSAEYGSVTITAIGKAGTAIPSGFQVSDGNLTYTLSYDAEILSTGSIDLLLYCDSVTSEVSTAGSVTQIRTPIAGLDSITNANPSIAGTELESDSSFRKRCLELGSLFKNGSYNSILANVAQVEGVTKIALNGENPTGAILTYKNHQMNPHSISVVALGGDDNDIAEVIADCKPTGTAMMGDVSVIVKQAYNELEYKFYRPTSAPLKFEVGIITNANSPTDSDCETQIQEALINYVDGLNIGDKITQPSVAQAVKDYVSGFEVESVKLSRQNGTPSDDALDLDYLELATISVSDISVTIKAE